MHLRSAVFVAIVVVLVGASSFVAFVPDRSGTAAFWALAAGPSLLLGAAAAAWAMREDYLAEWLTPRSGDITVGVLSAAVLFGGAWAFARTVTPVGSSREIWLVSLYAQLGDPRGLQAHALAATAGIAAVAFAEELLWRGAITQLLAERVGSRVAWIWAAVLYAAAYAPTMWALRSSAGLDPVLVLAALAGGFLWGGLARAFGRLTPSILAHAIFDGVVVVLYPLWGVRAS